jgi:hypothetical protein
VAMGGCKISKKITYIDIQSSRLESDILPLLKNEVFHVTSVENLCQILKDGKVISNADKKFKYSYSQSENSYGRKRGYICLFDLRNKEEDIIYDTLDKYYFLHPTQFQNKVVYLILKKELYCNLIENGAARTEVGYREVYIPYTEAWYPDEIFLENIKKIIITRIYQ